MDKILKYRCNKADGLKKPLCENMPEVVKINAQIERSTE